MKLFTIAILSFMKIATVLCNFYWRQPSPLAGSFFIPTKHVPYKRNWVLPSYPKKHRAFTDGFQPRFAGLFKNILSKVRLTSDRDHSIETDELCIAHGGVPVDSECLLYIDEPVTWEEARDECEMLGAHLYSPQKNELFLFQKFFLYYPEVFQAGLRDLAWIGASRSGPDAPITTEDGRDVTMESLYYSGANVNNFINPDCFLMRFDKGYVRVDGRDCTEAHPYICEFDFREMEKGYYHDIDDSYYYDSDDSYYQSTDDGYSHYYEPNENEYTIEKYITYGKSKDSA